MIARCYGFLLCAMQCSSGLTCFKFLWKRYDLYLSYFATTCGFNGHQKCLHNLSLFKSTYTFKCNLKYSISLYTFYFNPWQMHLVRTLQRVLWPARFCGYVGKECISEEGSEAFMWRSKTIRKMWNTNIKWSWFWMN
jgi:hypothetical protein